MKGMDIKTSRDIVAIDMIRKRTHAIDLDDTYNDDAVIEARVGATSYTFVHL
jgi:hypothetical protein